MRAVKVYTVGARVFCDFHFGGKPLGVAVAVLKPGPGNNSSGLVRVRITEDSGAYRKGQFVEVPSCFAVPRAQELRLKPGQIFRRVSTRYTWA
jgi:hypothetical protein